jgi:predicted DNA-binding transcriptional regulator AlpA
MHLMQHMGSEMLNNNSERGLQHRDLRQVSVPPELTEVALVDARACAATGGMSVSQWHNLVREGAAPKPVIRLPRYTRWGLSDVRKFFLAIAEQGSDERECMVIERAKRASLAAKAKRQQKARVINAAG